MAEYVRFRSGEWSGLYIDGKLDCYGDHYVADERLSDLLGVKDYYEDDSWLLDGDKPLPDLDAVEANQGRIAEAEEEAALLLYQAATLRERANEIMKGVGR